MAGKVTLLKLGLLAWLAWCGPAVLSAADGTNPESRPIIGQEVPVHAGDLCVVCGKPVGGADRAYFVDGQRISVHAEYCDGVLRASPERRLAALKPRGGLFGGEAPSGPVSYAWLLGGAYVLLGVCFAGICAAAALNRGLSPYAWLFAGLLFNIFAYAVLLTRHPDGTAAIARAAGLAKIPQTLSPQTCLHCGMTNHPMAEKCIGCGSGLQPAAQSEAARLRSGGA